MAILETLNRWAATWSGLVIGGLLDATLILVFAAILWLFIHKKASPQFGYGLFLLVILKLLIPIEIAAPVWMTYLTPAHSLTQIVRQSAFEISAPSSFDPRIVDPSAISSAPIVSQESVHRPIALNTDDHPISVSRTNPTPAAPQTILTWSARLMIGWAGVVFALLCGFAGMQYRTRKLFQRAACADPRALPIDFESLKQRAGVSKPVAIHFSEDISSPAIRGIFHPQLILPHDLGKTLTPNQLTWVILHELAHIRRRDLFVSLLQRMMQIVYFYNPAVWIANWAIDQLREYACDDAALAACGAPRRDCGEGFINLVERANSPGAPAASALGLFNPGTLIRQRLLRILDARRRIQHKLSWSAAILLGFLAIAVLPIVRAEQPTPAAQTAAISTNNVPGTGTYTFKGTVFDETNQKPVAAAKVILRKPYNVDIPNQDGETNIAETQTNASGAFEMGGIAAGVYNFIAQASGYIDYRPRGYIGFVHPHERIFLDRKHPTFDVQIKMQPGFVRQVYLIDNNRRPISGAWVKPFANNNEYEIAPLQTNENGYCVVNTIGKEKTALLIQHKDYGEMVVYSEKEDDNALSSETSISLEKPSSIAGRVTLPDGTPVMGMPIYAHPSKLYSFISCACRTVIHETVTDSHGYYQFKGLGDGDYSINNYHSSRKEKIQYDSIQETVTLAIGEQKQGVDLQTARVPLEGDVKGRVISEAGKSIVNARIRIDVQDTDTPKDYRGTIISYADSVTNPSGEFHLQNFTKPKTAEIEASAKGFLTEKQVYKQFDHPIEIVMQPAGTIRGVVVDADTQQPIANAIVRLYRELFSENEPSAHDHNDVFCITGIDGSFLLESVNAIPVRLITEAPGYVNQEGPTFNVKSGDNLGPIAITLKRGQVLSGKIIDESSRPIGNAFVCLRSKANNPNANFSGLVTYKDAEKSKKDGSFTIAGVPPDGDTVIVNHPDYAPKCLPLTPELLQKQPLSIVLNQGGVLEGTVFDSEGKPAQGEKITINNFPENSFTYQAFVDEKGNYRIDKLPAITFQVHSGTIWANDAHFNEVRTITIREGAATRADFGTGEGKIITGTVYKDGKPERNVQVSLQDSYEKFGQKIHLTTESDENGKYTLHGVPEGDLLLETWQGGDNINYYQKIAIAPNQNDYHADLFVKPYKVALTVYDKESGAPLPDIGVGTARPIDDSIPRSLYLSGKTDEKGIAALYPKEAGSHTLQIWKKGYIPQNISIDIKQIKPGEPTQETKIDVRLEKVQNEAEVRLSLDGQPYLSEKVRFQTFQDGYAYLLISSPGQANTYIVQGFPEGSSDLVCTVYEDKARYITLPETVVIKKSRSPLALSLSLQKTCSYQFLFKTQEGINIDNGFARFEIPDFPKFRIYEKVSIKQSSLSVTTPLGARAMRILIPGYKPLELNPKKLVIQKENPDSSKVVNLTLEKE